jgi:hypothetical protein
LLTALGFAAAAKAGTAGAALIAGKLLVGHGILAAHTALLAPITAAVTAVGGVLGALVLGKGAVLANEQIAMQQIKNLNNKVRKEQQATMSHQPSQGQSQGMSEGIGAPPATGHKMGSWARAEDERAAAREAGVSSGASIG